MNEDKIDALIQRIDRLIVVLEKQIVYPPLPPTTIPEYKYPEIFKPALGPYLPTITTNNTGARTNSNDDGFVG